MTIAEQLQELAQIKEEIRQAIIAKGVTVSSDAAFSTYATAIGQISGGGEEFAALIDRSIEEVVIPNGVTSIGNAAFRYCTNLISVTIPNSVTSIGASAFERCNNSAFTSITIPNSVTSIGNSAFQYCSYITSMEIPSSVTSIGGSAFSDLQKCTRIVINGPITTLSQQALFGSRFEYIDLPSSVTSFGNNAISSSRYVKTLICRATTPPTLTGTPFNNTGSQVASGKILYVPHGYSSAYTGATGTEWVDTLLNPSKCNFTVEELNSDGEIPDPNS